MSSTVKKVKRENLNLNYIELLQQSIENTEGGGDPLSAEQIIEEEEMVLEEPYEQHEKKIEMDSFDVTVDNQYEISGAAAVAAKGSRGDNGGDSDDEIRITVKRKRPKASSNNNADNASLNDIYMLLLSMDKRISNIEKWMKSTAGGANITVNNASVVTKLLPMKTVQELKEFDELLEESDFELAYVAFVQNAELKDLMEDNLIINFNYSGVHKKLALKSFRFVQVWKDNSNLPETEFAKNLKIEIGAAHNRHHSRQARLRKSAGGSS